MLKSDVEGFSRVDVHVTNISSAAIVCVCVCVYVCACVFCVLRSVFCVLCGHVFVCVFVCACERVIGYLVRNQ